MDVAALFSKRPDYHQLPSYARVMEGINWDVIPVSGSYLFVKRVGPISFGKLQRATEFDVPRILQLQKKLNILQLFIEPALTTTIQGKIVTHEKLQEQLLGCGFKQTNDHHAYTKTLVCSISGSENEVLSSFSQTLRYSMRKSKKTDVRYDHIPFSVLSEKQKLEIIELHTQWSKEKKVMGYTDSFLYSLWREMCQEGTMILARKGNRLIGALFLLTHHRVGMYFYQFSSKEARDKLYVPSGMAYHAIIVAREKGCDLFDLCSAYDERYGKEHESWKGFSEHKEHFHPTPVYYPPAFVRQFSLHF